MSNAISAIIKNTFATLFIQGGDDQDVMFFNHTEKRTSKAILEGQFSMINGGLKIPRVYVDDVLECKRVASINMLGSRWLNHPANFISQCTLN